MHQVEMMQSVISVLVRLVSIALLHASSSYRINTTYARFHFHFFSGTDCLG